MPVLLLLGALLAPIAADAAATGAAAQAATHITEARCTVWNREAAFAKSLADHDAPAFASYLHPDAVFIDGGNRPLRGAGKIAKGWAGLVEGKGVLLRWYPDAVDVGANGSVALSRGPYWMEFPGAPEAKRYMQGRFVSTWQRGDDGKWLVVFDGGGGNEPVPATAEDIAKLAAAQKSCP